MEAINMSVKIYTTKTCMWCKKTKGYLNEKNVEYEAVDVGADQKAANEMMEKSGQMSVPVIDINGTIIIGFDKDAIDKALAA